MSQARAESWSDSRPVPVTARGRLNRVVQVFGRLNAMDLPQFRQQDFDRCLQVLIEISRKHKPHYDEGGRETKLAHALHDAVRHFEMRRALAPDDVHWAVAPLFARRASVAEIRAAAQAAVGGSVYDGGWLWDWELDDLLWVEMEKARRPARLRVVGP